VQANTARQLWHGMVGYGISSHFDDFGMALKASPQGSRVLSKVEAR